jgi:tetratricopeptide (TPR) repeat protein
MSISALTKSLIDSSLDFFKSAQRDPLPVMRGSLFRDYGRLTMQHESSAQERNREEKDIDEGTVLGTRQSKLAAITHGVAPPRMKGLIPILLGEAVTRVNMIHTGRVLFVTSVGTAYRTVGVTLLVEDRSADRMLLQLYNYVRANDRPFDIFPKGTRLAVLEPYLRFPLDSPENPVCMRCDNPQHIRVLTARQWERAMDGRLCREDDDDDEKIGDLCAEDLRLRGNREFSASRLNTAIHVYSLALKAIELERTSNEGDGTLAARVLNNRAQCYAKQERWALALADSATALELDASYVKCAWLRAQALLMLQRPLEAHEAAASALLDKETDIAQLRNDVERAIREQQHGEYDWAALRQEVAGPLSEGILSRRHSDYEHPKIAVVQTETKGRGVIAQSSVPEGTLVMASKAFCITFANPLIVTTVVPSRNRVDSDSNAEMLPSVIQELLARPERSSELYSLSAGQTFSSLLPVPAEGAVDVLRISAILHNNWFGQASDRTEAMLALKRSRWHINTGQFLRPSDGKEMEEKLASEQKHRVKMGSGLWIRPSLFNHSCFPNCRYSVIGDFMFVFTTRDVKGGDELCIPYTCPDHTFEERSKVFANWNNGEGFVCLCNRCVAARGSPVLRKQETDVHEAFRNASQLTCTMDMREASDAVLPPPQRLLLLQQLKALSLVESYGVLCPLLELQAGSLVSARRFGHAVDCYQRLVDARRTVHGPESYTVARDSIRFSCTAYLACKGDVARTAMLAAFVALCLPRFHVPMSVPVFMELAMRYNVGFTSREEAAAALKELVEASDRSTNWAADHTLDAYCAHCTEGPGTDKKLKLCSRCGVSSYCSVEHQKLHWPIHKRVCGKSK